MKSRYLKDIWNVLLPDWKRRKPRKPFRYGINWFRWLRLLPCSSVCLFLSGCISQFLLTELHSEMGELHTYYRMQLEDHLMELETASKENPSEAVTHLLEAALQIEASCQQFDNQVLPTLPCSDEGIFAINQQYQNSLNSMQILCQQLNRVKEE